MLLWSVQSVLCRPPTLDVEKLMSCVQVAPEYNVTPKAVRDIWQGRTWEHLTDKLWVGNSSSAKTVA